MVRATLMMFAVACAGCSELPPIQYEREGFDLAVEFEHPVCEGTLLAMEDRVRRVERETAMQRDTPMTIYWLAGDLERICPRPTSGCFIPGTQIVASRGASLHHEIVHAVLNTRGSNPFAEEGLAEVLSGVAAFQNPAERLHPLDALRSTRKDAREGEIDYDRAAHFMHFVRSETGEETVAALAEAIDRGDAPERFVSLLEQQFALPAAELEQAYSDAPAFYPSGRAEETEPVNDFDLAVGVNLSLDCLQDETFGPLSEEDGGMYHLLRIEAQGQLEGTMVFQADPGVRASLFREADPEGEWVQDWWRPRPGLDPDRVELRGGERVQVSLDPSEHWLLMVRSSESDRTRGAHLRLMP